MLRRGMMAQSAGGGGSDPYWANVSALLHFDGADGSTTFTDQTGKTWTASGNAQIDTAQSKFGGASGLFDGSGDYIYSLDTPGFNFGSGDFTIEFWVRQSNATGFQNIVAKRLTSDYAPFSIALSAGQLRSRLSLNGTAWDFDQTSGATISTGTWTHIALTRSGTTVRQFVGGVLDGTSTLTGALMTNATSIYFGAQSDGASGLIGWTDEFRITKGVARYTANFTPPSAPFPDS